MLPLLADVADRDVAPVLIRQADLFAEVDELLGDLAAAVDPTSAAALVAAPAAVARTAVRGWLAAAGMGGDHPVDAATVGRVLAVAAGEAVAADLVGGWRVARTAGRLRLEPPDHPGAATAS